MASPFEDPSVQAATAPNPFASENSYDTNFWKTDSTGNENVSNNYSNNNLNKAYDTNNNNFDNNNLNNNNSNNNNNNNNNNYDDSSLDLRESNLLSKEKSLEERRLRLNNMYSEIESSNYREDNWPLQCYPITFHSITQEIPPFARPHMRKMYSLVLLTFFTLFWNLCAELAVFLTESGNTSSDDQDNDILWSTVYFFGGIFAAWKLWYRQIYYGLRDRKTIKWCIFFIVFIIHIAFSCYMAIGLTNGTGAAGFGLLFKTLQKNVAVGLCNLVAAVLWTIITLASIFLIKRSWSLFRQRGGMEQARTELTQKAMNQAIQSQVQGQNQNLV